MCKEVGKGRVDFSSTPVRIISVGAISYQVLFVEHNNGNRISDARKSPAEHCQQQGENAREKRSLVFGFPCALF